VSTVMPDALASIETDRIIDLDVREDLRNGREPFGRIMEARRTLLPGGVLRLRAIFEPVPLYKVLGKQGFGHWTERLADDDWRIWFYPDEAGTGAAVAQAPDATALPTGCGACEPEVIDVRGLEPPEPMVRTLEALGKLPPGGTLIQLNVRVPHLLLPQLDARGYSYTVHEEADDRVRVVINAPTA
jgi:uncharacterized protein (DUF2249 family)